MLKWLCCTALSVWLRWREETTNNIFGLIEKDIPNAPWVHNFNMKAIWWVVVEMMAGKELTNQRQAFSVKLLEHDGTLIRSEGHSAEFQYESDMISCRDNGWKRIDQSEASILQKITGAWWHVTAFGAPPRRPCIPSMKSMGRVRHEWLSSCPGQVPYILAYKTSFWDQKMSQKEGGRLIWEYKNVHKSMASNSWFWGQVLGVILYVRSPYRRVYTVQLTSRFCQLPVHFLDIL